MAIYVEGLILLVALALGGLVGYTWEHRHTVALQSAFKDMQAESKRVKSNLDTLSAQTQEQAASAAQELRDKTDLVQAQQTQYQITHAEVVSSANKQIATLIQEKQRLKDEWTQAMVKDSTTAMPILTQIEVLTAQQRSLECLQAQVPGALAEQLNSITGAP
jgi:uncharacterized protein with PhoU and TrkA domain